MGKKKIKPVSGETAQPVEKEKKEPKKVRVAGLKGGERVRVVEAQPIKAEKESEKIAETPRKKKTRGRRYLEAKKKIKKEAYPLKEAVALVKQTSLSRFVGNLEAHLVIDKIGEVGEVKLPYFKGKKVRVVVADDKVVAAIKAGKIDFDVLLASPKMMPKLLPFARVLGPKGLMPNPKNGTLTDEPEKAKEKFESGGVKIKTEKKAPVVHLVLGKLDQPDEELVANVETVIKAIGKGRIKKLVLAATMGPGVKVTLN